MEAVSPAGPDPMMTTLRTWVSLMLARVICAERARVDTTGALALWQRCTGQRIAALPHHHPRARERKLVSAQNRTVPARPTSLRLSVRMPPLTGW